MATRQVELVVRRTGQPEKRLPIGPGITHMGRAEDNDLVLPDIGVSRRHARISVDGDSVRFEDLGSGNGSFYRGRRVEQQVVVDGDEIVIEPFVLQFRITEPVSLGRSLEDDETMRAPDMEAIGAAPARLVVLAGHRLASAYPLGGAPVSMGRSEAREVVLYDPAASREHARVELRAEGYWLIDNGSANGTYVNGRRASQHPLSSGDVIRIGSTEFRFELLGPLPDPGRPGDDPTIRAPEALPVVPPAPPAPAAPPPQRPAPQPVAAPAPPPQAVAPVAVAPIAQAAPAAVSPAEQAMWAQPLPAEAEAPPAPEASNKGALLIALSAAAGFVLLVAMVGAGAGGWYLYQQQQQATAKAAQVAAATQAATPKQDSDEVSALMDEGRLLLHERRYLDSASRFYKVLQTEPEHVEAKRMGFLVVEAIALNALAEDAAVRGTDDATRRNQAKDAHALARRALGAGTGLVDAREAVAAALRLNPGNAELTDDLDRLRADIAKGMTPAELTRLNRKVSKIYQEGAEALAAGRSAEAVKAFEKVQKADPDRRTWYWYEANYGLAEAKAR